MTLRNLFDNLNHRVELGPQLSDGKGGEGAVYEIVGHPSSVAKVYHKLPETARVQKLRAMLNLARPEMLTWPTQTLHQGPNGQLVGFLMPRAPGKEVHTLYSPAQRRKEVFR